MPPKLTKEQFIDRANKSHNFKYDYSEVNYTGSMKKVNIICPIHGSFEQTPSRHVNDKRGCFKCGHGVMSAEDFIEQAQKVHGDRYDYFDLQFVNSQEKVNIICKDHGPFKQLVFGHLKGLGCAKCSGTHQSNTKEFIKKSKKVHGDRFDYSKVKYTRAVDKVKIICKKHGVFEQTPNGHLSGRGCRKCADELRKGGFSEEYFRHFPQNKNRDCVMYSLRLYNENEEFYKIGITTETIQKRFKYHMKYYNYELLNIKEGQLYELYLYEQQLLNDNHMFQYFPERRFSGYTECFSEKIEI